MPAFNGTPIIGPMFGGTPINQPVNTNNLIPQTLATDLKPLPNYETIQTAPESGIIQGIRQTGQGFGQLATGARDYITQAPIKNELGISDNKLPAYNEEVKAQRNQFNKTYENVPGIDTYKYMGAALPYAAIPFGETSILGNALIGADIGGSQFAKNGKERLENTGMGAGIGATIPAAFEGIKWLSKTPAAKFLANKLNKYFVDAPKQFSGQQTPEMVNQISGGVTPQMMANVLKAKLLGLDYITPAEAAGKENPYLAAVQGNIGKTEEGQQILLKKQVGRTQSESNAIDSFLNDISQNSSPANKEVRDLALQLIKNKRAQLSDVTNPMYTQAEGDIIPSSAYSEWLKDPAVSSASNYVKNSPLYQSDYNKWLYNIEQNPLYKNYSQSDIFSLRPENTVKHWNLVRQRLSEEGQPGALEKFSNENRIASNIANKLNTGIDTISPAYQQARQAYAAGSPEIDALENSKIGEIAKLNDTQLKNVSQKIFDPNETDPAVLSDIKSKIQSHDPELWNRLTRNEIERRMDAMKTDKNGLNFYKAIMGNDRDYNLFRIALSDNPAAQKLDAMHDVFPNLINPIQPRSAEYTNRINLQNNRNNMDKIESAIMNMLGGKRDTAAVNYMTNPDWIKQYSILNSGKPPPLMLGNILKRAALPLAYGAFNQ